MIKDFLIKKENIFIFCVALISIFFIVLGFLFLFFKTNSQGGPRVVPNLTSEIIWKDFSSKILKKDIEYPEYMYIGEQQDSLGVGVTLSEFKPKEFLTYFSNQNHVSIYPEGMDNQLFYGKTKDSEYTNSLGQNFLKTEYLTSGGIVWAVMLVPRETPSSWQTKGFIWIQSAIKNKETLCLSSGGILITDIVCDPYVGEEPVYRGDVSEQFIRFGYEIINKNSF